MKNKLCKSKLMWYLFFLLLLSSCKTEKNENDLTGKYMTLHDGRILSYRGYGNADGEPVFYFHGYPSSGMEFLLNNGDMRARDLNLRIIAVNRPGYGNSDFQIDRTLLDWPDDISELADSLKIDSFSVLGVSGGGPYAIVCAYKISGRLKKVGVVSGMGPYNAPEMENGASAVILKSPRFIQNMMFKGFKKTIQKNPDKITKRMRKGFPDADRKIIDIPQERDILLNALYEGLSAGPEGAKQDAEIYKGDWGFALEDVDHLVYLWHGEEDLSVRIETGKYVADNLANCEPTYYPGEGHFSLLYNRADEIYTLFIPE